MKILIVGPDLTDPGGVANYYNAVLPSLYQTEYEISYLEIGSTKSHSSRWHPFLDQLRFFSMVNKLKPNLVHLNPSLNLKSLVRDGLFLMLAKLSRRRVLVFFRGWDTSFEKWIDRLLKPFFQISFKRADVFIVLAREFETRLRHWGVRAPILLGTTTVNENLLRDFSIDQRLVDLAGDQRLKLLFLARLEQDKGVLELIEALNILLDKGQDLTLTIAGNGPIVQMVQKQVDAMGENRHRVSLLGYIRGEDKSETFRTHHLFCFPTQYGEGMPNSLLEAMAFGLPIVTCPVGGIADFFQDGTMGSLLAKPTPERLAQAIMSLATDRPRLLDIAKYNFQYANEHFMATTSAKFLAECYGKTLSHNRDT